MPDAKPEEAEERAAMEWDAEERERRAQEMAKKKGSSGEYA
jgi:hypothetical protein